MVSPVITHPVVVNPAVQPLEIFRPVQLPHAEEPPEPRLTIRMTVTEYQRLVTSLQDRVEQARAMGQGQGAQAMNEIVIQMSQLVERLYQEGRELQQRHDRLEALLRDERSLAAAWLERTKSDLQKQAR